MSSSCLLRRHSDSFHEASIEALSLAAMPPAPLHNDETFPDPPDPPLIYPTSLAENWHRNLLVLPHHAIRAELTDLCRMLRALPTCSRYAQLSVWFTPFRTFVTDYLTFETEVLIPWIFSQAHQSIIPLRSKLASLKLDVVDALDELTHALTLFSSTSQQHPPTHVLPVALRCSGQFIDVLEQYFRMEEKSLPPVIEATRTKEQAGYVEHLMAKRLDIGILLRWIPNRDRRAVRRRLGWWRWSRHLREHLLVVKQICAAS